MNNMIFIIILIIIVLLVSFVFIYFNNDSKEDVPKDVSNVDNVQSPNTTPETQLEITPKTQVETVDIEIIKVVCSQRNQGDEVYRAYNKEGVLGGYKIINDSENPDTAFTEWIDKEGKDFAYMSPISKPTQEALKASEEFDNEFTELTEVDCFEVDKNSL